MATISPKRPSRWCSRATTDNSHTVTSGEPGDPDGHFDSGTLNPGDEFSHTFDDAGDFSYFCAPHSAQQQGTIVVDEER